MSFDPVVVAMICSVCSACGPMQVFQGTHARFYAAIEQNCTLKPGNEEVGALNGRLRAHVSCFRTTKKANGANFVLDSLEAVEHDGSESSWDIVQTGLHHASSDGEGD